MAKLKSEVLQLHFDKYGVPLTKKLTRYAPYTSRMFSGKMAGLINFIQKSIIFRKILHQTVGIHEKRILPNYTSETLGTWSEKNNKYKSDKKVVFFADTYLNNHQPELGIKAVKLLNSCGYEVIIAEPGCCQRPLISNGHLKEAKKQGSATVANILPYFEKNIPIVTFEPSCHTALTDDLPDLIDDAAAAKLMTDNIKTIEVFLAEEYSAGKLTGHFSVKDPHLVIHGHCHQKADYGTKATKYLLQTAGASFKELNTGCCGMAGAFGYEKEHYDISLKIAEESLGPGLDLHPESVVLAHGFSCKHQIADIRRRPVKHVVEVLNFTNQSKVESS